MKTLTKIVTRITEDSYQRCNEDSPSQDSYQDCYQDWRTQDSGTQDAYQDGNIHESKILSKIVIRIPAVKIFTELVTKSHEPKTPVLRFLRKL